MLPLSSCFDVGHNFSDTERRDLKRKIGRHQRATLSTQMSAEAAIESRRAHHLARLRNLRQPTVAQILLICYEAWAEETTSDESQRQDVFLALYRALAELRRRKEKPVRLESLSFQLLLQERSRMSEAVSGLDQGTRIEL
jgi:hypothetical protein